MEDKTNDELNELVKQENYDAMMELADRYLNGTNGAEQNYEEAFKLYTKVAETEDEEAMYMQAFCYLNGYGVPQDAEKAMEIYKSEKFQDSVDATYMLGYMFFMGLGIEKDYEIARRYFEKAANEEDNDSLFYLGNIYYEGLGVEKDYTKAASYFEKVSDDKDASYYLGKMYFYGEGLSKDYVLAKKYFEIAAENGNVEANHFLGRIYYYGNEVSQDFEKAKEYFEKAKDSDLKDNNIYLGNLYLWGNGTEVDYRKARDYYEIDEAYKLNKYYTLEYAEILLLDKTSEKEDIAVAIDIYENLKESIEFESLCKYRLSQIYIKGLQVDKNFDKAKKYLEEIIKSAKPFDMMKEVLYMLGGIYYDSKEYSASKRYFEASVKHGSLDANYYLGKMYYYGYDVDKDLDKAKSYFEKIVASDSHFKNDAEDYIEKM